MKNYHFDRDSSQIKILYISLLITIVPLALLIHQFTFIKNLFYGLTPQYHKLLSLGTALIISYLLINQTPKVISRLSNRKLFIKCPACIFDNRRLTGVCHSCGYKYGDCLQKNLIIDKKVSNNFHVPLKVLQMTGILENEEIVYLLKTSLAKAMISYDGINKLNQYVIITSNRLIFLGYLYIRNGWVEKETIHLKDIISVKFDNKLIGLQRSPYIYIYTSENRYYLIKLVGLKRKIKSAQLAEVFKSLKIKISGSYYRSNDAKYASKFMFN